MPKYEHVLAELSRPDIGEHKFDGTRNRKLGVGKWKKIGVLAFQKVVKTGSIGKKSPVASNIDYEIDLSMQKVNCTHLITAGQLNVNN